LGVATASWYRARHVLRWAALARLLCRSDSGLREGRIRWGRLRTIVVRTDVAATPAVRSCGRGACASRADTNKSRKGGTVPEPMDVKCPW
jgi:hypothetical protein